MKRLLMLAVLTLTLVGNVRAENVKISGGIQVISIEPGFDLPRPSSSPVSNNPEPNNPKVGVSMDVDVAFDFGDVVSINLKGDQGTEKVTLFKKFEF